MNTQLAFAFGMLAMVAIMMLAAIVVGIVKVIKLEKQLKELDRATSKETEFVHRHITDIERAIYSELKEYRDRFDQFVHRVETSTALDEVYKQIEETKRELQAYTDSRFDKSLRTVKKEILND
jgi:5'-deoxynucleotidase YfbR-like HD superfamily hydrolase